MRIPILTGAISAAVDFLLLMGTAQSAGQGIRTVRLAGAAAIGGVYNACCLFPGGWFLKLFGCRLACMLAMAVTAFGFDRTGLVFLLLLLALNGTAEMIGAGSMSAFLIAALVVMLLYLLSSQERERPLTTLEIGSDGKHLCLTALRDTGNYLRDPVTGETVTVIGPAAARALTGLSREQLLNPMDTLCRTTGFRLIPFHSLGCQAGFLLAKRFPMVRIGRTTGPGVIAFSPMDLDGDGFQAITGGYV